MKWKARHMHKIPVKIFTAVDCGLITSDLKTTTYNCTRYSNNLSQVT
jgi:hypothetical protein